MDRGKRTVRDAGESRDGGAARPHLERRHRFRRRRRVRTFAGRSRPARADLRAARSPARILEQGAARRARRAHRPLHGERRQHAQRRQVRHRRRHRHARPLRGARRAARVARAARRGCGPARPHRAVRGPPPVGPAGRRGGAHQRVQLPGLGHLRESGVRSLGGNADPEQARHQHRARRLASGGDRSRHPSGRRFPIHLRLARRSARPARTSGRGRVHRLLADRGKAARAARAPRGAPERRSGLLERGGPRA